MFGMAKYTQQRRTVIILPLSLSLSIFLFLWASSSRTFTRSLDSYITSGITWIDNDNNNGDKTPCWEDASPLYHCFRALSPGSTNNPLRSATEMEALMVPTQPWHPSHCIDGFFTDGEPCSGRRPTTLDVVWTWVNGSDAFFQQALLDAAADPLATRKNAVAGGKLYR